MDRKTRKIIEDLNRLKGQLSERYIFSGEEGEGDFPQEQYMDGESDEMMDAPQMEGPQQSQMQQGDNAEEQAMHAQDVIKHEPIIGKIRETAIEGLKKYADYPTSSLYEFFKKVFLESDKVLTDTGNKK